MREKLYRSRTDSMIAGVCGGLAEHFGLDSSLVRIIFVLLVLVPPCLGILIYLAMWLIVPRAGAETTPQETVRAGAAEIAEKARAVGEEVRSTVHRSRVTPGTILGLVFVVLGVAFLLVNLGFLWASWIWRLLWPGLLLVVGLALLLRHLWRDGHDR